MTEEGATASESQEASPTVKGQTVPVEDALEDEDGAFFDDDEGEWDDAEAYEDDDGFFDDDDDDAWGEACEDDGEDGEKPAAYKKVQGATDDLNSIYHDGAAVAKELKDAYEDIKKLMDIRGLFKF